MSSSASLALLAQRRHRDTDPVDKVYLPRVDEPAEAGPSGAAPAEAPRGHETILLVEDTETLRDVIREILEERGYTVLLASNGEEALALARAREGPIDVVMPKLGADKLARAVREALDRPIPRG